MNQIEADARKHDPEFWESWDACPERFKMQWHYAAMVIQLDNARERLGLPEGTPLTENQG
jgi:hypothetical protein